MINFPNYGSLFLNDTPPAKPSWRVPYQTKHSMYVFPYYKLVTNAGELDRKKWPLLASHLDMMYGDDEDPEGNAQSYKDDGNREYKKGTKEGFHKAILSYSGEKFISDHV